MFPEIKTFYDYYSLKVYDKEIKLTYRIRQYQKIKNQDAGFINNLKRNNTKLRYFKIKDKNDNIVGFYYKEYAIKTYPLSYRVKLINKILSMKHEFGHTLRDEIEYKWNVRNCFKTTTTELRDRESIVLDILASYYDPDNSNLLIREMNKVNKNEVSNIYEKDNTKKEGTIYENDTKKWEIRNMSKKRKKSFENRNKMQVRRWKSSNTYKLNNIYSFDSHINHYPEWDWLNHKWRLPCRDVVKREGLINPYKPYISEWCVVDIDNCFEFGGNKYQIDKSVSQYDKRNVSESSFRNDYVMDRVLCIKQEDRVYFFDQDINLIKNELVINIK